MLPRSPLGECCISLARVRWLAGNESLIRCALPSVNTAPLSVLAPGVEMRERETEINICLEVKEVFAMDIYGIICIY